MKIKWGALVVAGRGKIGGHVGSRNSAGDYLRTKVTPVNPNTSAQARVRTLLTVLSQAWRGITQIQRNSWNGAVADFARTDIFGDLKNPTGFNLFQRLNNNIDTAGGVFLSSAPRPESIATVTIGALAIDTGAGDASTLAISATVPVGSAMQIWMTAGLSAGKSFVKSEYRLLQVEAPGSTSPVDVQAAYVAKFGVPATGSKVFAQIKFVNIATGQASTTQSTSTIVVST